MWFLVWLLATGFAIAAGWTDLRSRRIPNRLTVAATATGITVNVLAFGWVGVKTALLGMTLALVLFLPFVLLKGLGAGDWKLMGAIGSLLGPRQVLTVILITVFIAGLMAIVDMISAGRLKETLKNLAILVHGFFAFGVRPHAAINLSNANMLTIPFGVAAAMGTLLSFGMKAVSRIV